MGRVVLVFSSKGHVITRLAFRCATRSPPRLEKPPFRVSVANWQQWHPEIMFFGAQLAETSPTPLVLVNFEQ